MKKLFLIILVFLLLGCLLLWNSFRANDLIVGEPPQMIIPEFTSPANMKVTAISTGHIFSQQGLSFRGGSFDKKLLFPMGGVLIDHPKGRLLLDAGFATNVDEQIQESSKLMQMTTEYETDKTVIEQLPKLGLGAQDINAVILTHAHWDHVSGLSDFPDVPVWLTQNELDFVNSGSELTDLARRIGTQNYRAIDFEDKEYLGFAQSYDVHSDGSVIIVPAYGHTPGALVVFVTISAQEKYAFIGDLAWQKEAINRPAEKPWLLRSMLGEDTQALRTLLIRLHHLQKLMPELLIVPSHDRDVWESLPRIKE